MLANPMKYVICYMGVKQVNGFFYVNYGIKSKAIFSRLLYITKDNDWLYGMSHTTKKLFSSEHVDCIYHPFMSHVCIEKHLRDQKLSRPLPFVQVFKYSLEHSEEKWTSTISYDK